MAVKNLKEFLARQLNDHEESPSGVIQKTFYEWTEGHICDAICLGICYMYSLMPQDFVEVKTFKVTQADCVIDFNKLCPRFINLLTMTTPSGEKASLNEKDAEIRSLLPLLKDKCRTASQSEESLDYDYDLVDDANGLVLFDKDVPKGTILRYTCSSEPGIDDLDSEQMCQYHPLIADYALWWLFRTDSESRSNLERARLHFEGVRDFVTTKLLLEFSLKEDDYNYGRVKTPDK